MVSRPGSPPDVRSTLVSYVLYLLSLGHEHTRPLSTVEISWSLTERQDVLVQLTLPGGDVGQIVLQGGMAVYASYGEAEPEAALTTLVRLAPQCTASLRLLPPDEAELLFAALSGTVRRFVLPVSALSELLSLQRALVASRFSGVVLIEDRPRIDIHLVQGGLLQAALASTGRVTILSRPDNALEPLRSLDPQVLRRTLMGFGVASARQTSHAEVWKRFEREVSAELGERSERFLLRMHELYGPEQDPERLRLFLNTELRRVRGSG
ncbi:hypothetical protein [Deinococcus sp.]|uniref:hypothetical protein n=1 Tax=Deinococcus sp. TaxID=47478 RepID=UPI0025ED21EE|nr:hypothetical protein [Deinococcus sp.]